MLHNQKIVCIIPARLASQRFPQKLLSSLAGKPLLQWVWEAAKTVAYFDEVLFAIDDERLGHVIQSFNGRWIMTPESCSSGTDRIVHLMKTKSIMSDLWVNWQADEPFVTSSMINELLQSVTESSSQEKIIWTLKKKITNTQDLLSQSVAKVVCDARGHALYFSRSIIPCVRDEKDPAIMLRKTTYYKHIGIYAYTTKALRVLAEEASKNSLLCSLEESEKLESLGFLYHSIPIKTEESSREVFGIDWPEDLVRAEKHVTSIL